MRGAFLWLMIFAACAIGAHAARGRCRVVPLQFVSDSATIQVDCFDAYMPGLILRINHGGAKLWRVRCYLKRTGKDGKQVSIPTTYRLGLYPLVSLKEAREKARH